MLGRSIVFLYKFFFIGLLLQFFLHTFITYQVGMDASWMQYVWLWKEGVIALLGLLALGGIIGHRRWKQIIISPTIGRWTLGLIIAVGITATIHIVFLEQPLSTYILAFKYDFLGFFILLIGLHSSSFLSQEQQKEIIQRYGKIIKRALRGALIRYFIIFIKPGTLKLFGYDNFIYEGMVGAQPPAAYYTLINHGITRNQFLFERPISWGFFLIAFFPLFYMLYLHRQPAKWTRGWWGLYGLNIILTFSRAAWGAWIIELGILGCIVYRRNIQTFLRKIVLPAILVLGTIGTLGYQSIIQREYSTTGHIAMVQQGRQLFTEQPLLGHGGGRAGPGSHREGGPKFNPENQFLQIMIEFGIIGFLLRFALYLPLNLVGILPALRQKQQKKHRTLVEEPLLMALSLGMIGISAAGMVLHSFSDRMIVYPLMLLFGIIWMQSLQQHPKKN